MTYYEIIYQIDLLKTWFTWYDTQVVQYNRDIRLTGISQINLSQLDQEAVEKAAKIKDLRQQIQNYFKK